MMAEMSGAQYMAELMTAYGVKAFFFMPSILRRMLALMEDYPIKQVVTHGEKAAAYMADGYARASGRPGVCGAQTVGAANLAAGLRDAYMAHSPVISLIGGRFGHSKHKLPYQEVDDYPMFVPVTKANFQVDEAGRIPDLMRQAFREATTGTPGPVNLQFMGNHAEIERNVIDHEVIVEERHTQVPAYRPRPDMVEVERVAQRLREAERPVIVAGGGVRTSGAGQELLELADTFYIPIANSTGGLSLVPENHPLYFGVPGTYSRSCSNDVMLQTDLVLFVGSETGGLLTHFWQIPPLGTEIIQIGIEPRDLGRNYPNSVSVMGDAKLTLQALLDSAGSGERRESWVSSVQKIVANWRAEMEPLRSSDALPMRPERVMKELGDCLPEDVLLVCDTAHSTVWASQHLWMKGTKWDFIRCAGSLGWAFPASLGAKCALPDRPVVCFTGDGGFWYHLQEVETAVRCGINSVTVVNNNNSQGGAKLTEVNLSRMAEEMGALGIRVEEPGALASALEQALSSGRPAVLEMMTDINVRAPRVSLG
ncbi:thiamine pyrophosphate-binding protein [Nitrospinota bacterium]